MPAFPVFGNLTQPGTIAGVTEIPAWGQRQQYLFFTSGPGFPTGFVAGDTWTSIIASTEGTFTIGAGQLLLDPNKKRLSPTFAFTYRNRMYLAQGSQFNFSDNGDPTQWEQQGPGAGFIQYLSNFGAQDIAIGLQQLQGRLLVIGRRSIQIWTVDADPSNFTLVQEMDYIGTKFPLSAQNIGDFDVIILDDTGFRSLRQREVTQNAYVDDVGIPVDNLVNIDLAVATSCCSIVDPQTKRYWSYLNGKIYVLSRYPSAKISAWSIYLPVDSNGVAFIPEKFIIINGIVYCRTTDRRFIAFGGATGTAFDNTVVTVELPWLDDKKPKVQKLSQGVDIACAGQWHVAVSMDPQTFALQTSFPKNAFDVRGPTGDESADSSFDLRRIGFAQQGTHFKLVAKTDASWTDIATLSEIQFHYNEGAKI